MRIAYFRYIYRTRKLRIYLINIILVRDIIKRCFVINSYVENSFFDYERVNKIWIFKENLSL